jgi:hypothetical protein
MITIDRGTVLRVEEYIDRMDPPGTSYANKEFDIPLDGNCDRWLC